MKLRAAAWILVLALCLGSLCVPVSAAERPGLCYGAAVRRGAQGSSMIIGYLPSGTAVDVLGRQGAYYRIDCYDMEGYILAEQVVRRVDGYYVNCEKGDRDTQVYPLRTLEEAVPMTFRLYAIALEQLGTPYVSGGSGPGGFDCSGFTQYVYARLGIRLPRTCDGQLAAGIIVSRECLQRGDLVLFRGTGGSGSLATHVGIYLGEGKLIHAGSRGITVVELDSDYFSSHYLCARRVLLTHMPQRQVSLSAGAERIK